MKIGGLQRTTLVDYPGKVAATVFTQGCNFRCPYCHNPELVLPERFEAPLPTEDFFSFLASRQGKLDAVCITGGEPTVQPDLASFIARIKELGFLVKLDSNGSRPDLLAKILAGGNVDYVAMDVKAPLEKYSEVAGISPFLVKQIEKSITVIMESGVDYEFRTTVMHPLLDVNDIEIIGGSIRGAKRYFLQNYQKSKQVSSDTFTPFTPGELAISKCIMETYVKEVGIR